MRTYNEKEIRNIFKQQGYKYACLKDAEGKVRVTYNTESTKGGANSKVEESFKRLANMPDGIYTFCFLNSKGRNVTPDEYGFLKGNVATDESGKAMPYHIINQLPVSQSSNDKVLSYPEVLNLKMELATVTFERDQLNRELVKANQSITELQAEMNELESKTPLSEDANSPMKWVESLGTTLMPLADRWMSLREKELEHGKRQPQRQAQTQRKPLVKKFVLPVIDSPEWHQWMTNLENASEEDFNKTLEIVKSKSMNHYNAIVEEFSDEEPETDEEQQTEE